MVNELKKYNNFDKLRDSIIDVVKDYPVTKVVLFGSRARGDNKFDSDVDLLCEFKTPSVSLLTLSGLKIDLEEKLGLPVDVIHGPLESDSIIEVDKEIPIYES